MARKNETKLQSAIMRALELRFVQDAVFWRNNTGAMNVARQGEPKRFVRWGLGKGGADIVGIVERDGVGVFCALEVKIGRGDQTPDQRRWGETVRSFGGHYSVVRSVEQAIAAVQRCLEGCSL